MPSATTPTQGVTMTALGVTGLPVDCPWHGPTTAPTQTLTVVERTKFGLEVDAPCPDLTCDHTAHWVIYAIDADTAPDMVHILRALANGGAHVTIKAGLR